MAIREVRNKFDDCVKNDLFIIQIIDPSIEWDDHIKTSVFKEIKECGFKKNFPQLFSNIHDLSHVTITSNSIPSEVTLEQCRNVLRKIMLGIEEFVFWYVDWLTKHYPEALRSFKPGVYTLLNPGNSDTLTHEQSSKELEDKESIQSNQSLEVNSEKLLVGPYNSPSFSSTNSEGEGSHIESDKKVSKEQLVEYLSDNNMSKILQHLQQQSCVLTEYRKDISLLTVGLTQLVKENNNLKEELKILSTSKPDTKLNEFIQVQEEVNRKQKEGLDTLLSKIQQFKDQKKEQGSNHLSSNPAKSMDSNDLTSHLRIVHEEEKKNGEKEGQDADSKIITALSKIVDNNNNNSKDNLISKSPLPKEFEPKGPLENYQWFASLESHLNCDHRFSLSDKLELLKRLVVGHANGWLQFKVGTTKFASWNEVRAEFFEKFVTTRKSAKSAFKKKMIVEGQSPEHFLYELCILADICGIANKVDYEIILKDRFLYGLQDAIAYQFYYLHKDMFRDVDGVLRQLRSSGRLTAPNYNELKLKKGEDFFLTQNMLGFNNPKKFQKKSTSSAQYHYKEKQKPTSFFLNNEDANGDDIIHFINDNCPLSEEEVVNLHIQGRRPPCESCGGAHSTQLCFKNKECPHCKVVGHDLINCFKLCKCRFLLSFNKPLKGIPHIKEESCPINWNSILGSLIDPDSLNTSNSKN